MLVPRWARTPTSSRNGPRSDEADEIAWEPIRTARSAGRRHSRKGTRLTKPLPPAPITLVDVKEFVANAADFAFEMRALQELTAIGIKCQHSGTYQDSATSKTRQFDIRGEARDGNTVLHLAIECKNVRNTAPLLIHATTRTSAEAFHEVLVTADHLPASTQSYRLNAGQSLYMPRAPVGKATDQIARRAGGGFNSSDADVFDKITQALASAEDLVARSIRMATPRQWAVVVPLLVLPDGCLWRVDYDANGKAGEPRQVNASTLYIARAWAMRDNLVTVPYCVSHLEVVTLGELANRVNELRDPLGVFRPPIPPTK